MRRLDAAAGALAGLIMPQPISSGGSLPRTGRSNVRGTSGTRSGNCVLISGGGAGLVSAAGHTITAPFSRMSSAVTQGECIGSEAK